MSRRHSGVTNSITMYVNPVSSHAKSTQEQTPRKRKCVWTGNGTHYFVPETPGQIFCSHACRKADERDIPR